jgi:hypothetical protein
MTKNLVLATANYMHLPCCASSPVQTDTFFISSPDIGAVHSLRISHDCSGLGPAWHLASIQATNTSCGETLLFPYHGWLDEKHGTSQLLWPDRWAVWG